MSATDEVVTRLTELTAAGHLRWKQKSKAGCALSVFSCRHNGKDIKVDPWKRTIVIGPNELEFRNDFPNALVHAIKEFLAPTADEFQDRETIASAALDWL